MNKNERKESFCKLEKLAKSQGISFYAIAKALDFRVTIFSDWKAGRSMPKTDKLLKIANYFGVTVDYFLNL